MSNLPSQVSDSFIDWTVQSIGKVWSYKSHPSGPTWNIGVVLTSQQAARKAQHGKHRILFRCFFFLLKLAIHFKNFKKKIITPVPKENTNIGEGASDLKLLPRDSNQARTQRINTKTKKASPPAHKQSLELVENEAKHRAEETHLLRRVQVRPPTPECSLCSRQFFFFIEMIYELRWSITLWT